MTVQLTAEQLFDGESLRGPTFVELNDQGTVSRLEPATNTPDVALVTPGLIDLQMNGFNGVDVATASLEDLESLDTELLSLGTTWWLGTIVTAPLHKMSETVAKLSTSLASTTTGCLGLHIEGPFLGSAPGAHRPEWIVPIDFDWINTLPNDVKVLTLAPEQTQAVDAIRQCVERGIVVSLGHTRASAQEFSAAVEAGASMVTHVFNGMSGVHHRTDGVATETLISSSVVAGLIVDTVHVSPSAVKLAFSAKGAENIALVSDSVAWNSPWSIQRGVTIDSGAPRLADGTLAGSNTPLSRCVRNAVKLCGVSLVDALRAATSTPARVLGYPQLGKIELGKPADLVCFDEALHVSQTHRRLVFPRG